MTEHVKAGSVAEMRYAFALMNEIADVGFFSPTRELIICEAIAKDVRRALDSGGHDDFVAWKRAGEPPKWPTEDVCGFGAYAGFRSVVEAFDPESDWSEKKTEDLLPALNADEPSTPELSPAERWFGRRWYGTLSGDFQEVDVAWDLAFDLEVLGNQFVGSGFLRGSATSGKTLEFSIQGASQTHPAEDSASMLIAVTDPLPKTKLYMRFELPDPAFSPDLLLSHWRLHCMQPSKCGCSGGSGDFEAKRRT